MYSSRRAWFQPKLVLKQFGRTMSSDDATIEQIGDPATGRAELTRALLVLDGTDSWVHILPKVAAVTIGRSPQADVRIDRPSVSRMHARLSLGPHVTIEDLGSSNGTKVGGIPLKHGEAALVASGSPIEVGAVVLLLHVGRASTSSVLTTASTSRDADQAIERAVRKVAASDIAVLLLGETGVGKEKLARDIHERSRRAAGPFVVVRGLSLAEAQAAGDFERGRGGTLVLDELLETDVRLQRALTKTLDDLGRDVRVLATCREDISAAVEDGRLLPELYHRVNGITVVIPPLRARIREIGPLALELASEAARSFGRPPPLLAPDALALLERHSWPGNVRELAQAMHRAVTMSPGRILTASHFTWLVDDPGKLAPRGGALKEARDAAEYQRILEALRECGGNQTHAARMLGVSRGTLVARLARYKMKRSSG